ncbi:MAG: AAA family ATPase, partial [Desulfobacteraceae bacterium]|nr:AAA family ATPase [Desulfobacteraceae bacterium]
MLKSLTIKNYKSLYNITIELGRINIFIGENGCGKTNILEALAVAGASKALDMDAEGLYNRGVRPAKPNLTFSSFKGLKQNKKIRIDLEFQERDEFLIVPSVLYCEDENDIYCKWKDEFLIYLIDETELHLNKKMQDIITHKPVINKRWFINDFSQLTEYVVYSLNTKSLRGINSESRKTPLGINGESLDILLSQFSGQEWDQLTKYCYLIFWLDEIFTDEKDSLKFKGHKLGRSNSILYFKDRFMRKKEMNNVFSAENANDGVLYILFYLALFISRKTPCFFGIDNIETCL